MNDIEVLEERVTTLKRHIKNYEENDCLTDVYQQLVKECRAIENLLKERQSDKERIKDLEEDNYVYHQLMRMQNEREYRSKFLKDFKKEYGENVMPDYDEIYKRYDKQKRQLENSIPKSLIKEKIEELKDIKLCGGNINQAIIEDKIQVLEELLNGKM